MKTIQGEILEVGVDWITAVALSAECRERMEVYCVATLSDERESGNDFSPWRFAGYEGFKCGSIQYGTRFDSSCVRVSSGLANECWRRLWQDAEKVTRLDLQITMRTKLPVLKVLAMVHRCALRDSGKTKDAKKVTLIRSNDGSGTVYLGSRKSAVFGRAYIKGAESMLKHYERTVRFEVEIKGSLCHEVLRRMCAGNTELLAVAGYVCGFFDSRGCSLEVPAVDKYTLRVCRKATDDERRLTWLSGQVRPSVESLVHRGNLIRVINSLGLSEYVTVRET